MNGEEQPLETVLPAEHQHVIPNIMDAARAPVLEQLRAANATIKRQRKELRHLGKAHQHLWRRHLLLMHEIKTLRQLR